MAAEVDHVMAAIEAHGTEVKSQLSALKAENKALKEKLGEVEGKLGEEITHRENLERKANLLQLQPAAPRGASVEDAPPQLVNPRTGAPRPALSSKTQLTPLLYPRPEAEPNVGRMLRALTLGGPRG